MQLFCICRKCATPRPLAPCGPPWALLLFFFIYIYLLDDLTRCWRCLWHLRLLGDRGKLTAERECRPGKGEKGKLDARQAAGKWQHYECGRHRATYRFMWHIYLLIRMQFIYIYAHNLHLTDFYEAPQSVAQPGTASLLQHQQQAKRENEEATDWSMNNKNTNVQCFSSTK